MRSIVFCTTCKYSSDSKVNGDGVTGGELLAREMEALLAAKGRGDIKVERQECLWACTRHCNVLLRDSDRYSYLTGGFAPGQQSARDLLLWFDLHGQSKEGSVPFRQWPDGMRGHFIARIPPQTQ